MCDYSLHGFPSRLAREGDDLETYRFGTGTIGLASRADLCRSAKSGTRARGFWGALRSFLPTSLFTVPAVCIPPGARLQMVDIPVSVQNELGVAAQEVVIFTQTTAQPNTHHDAVIFANGRTVLLHNLKIGLRIKVVSLGSDKTERVGAEDGVEDIAPARLITR